MKVVFKVMSEDTLKRQRQEDEKEEEKEEEPLTKIHWVSIAISGGAVTMLALAILLCLYFKWRVIRCCNSRETEPTQVITKPSAPTSDLEMALRMNQSLAFQLLEYQWGESRFDTLG